MPNKSNFDEVKKFFSTYRLMWLVYILFLGVLMPHTAWTFRQGQESKDPLNPLPWMLAFAVECVIAVFTHKLSEHLTVNRKAKGWQAVAGKWVNGYSVGLIMVLIISSMANLAYSVQFTGPLSVFAEWGIDRKVYEFSFGAMLPFVSLVFALVLSKMAETEAIDSPELQEAKRANDEAKKRNAELRQALQDSERQRKEAEAARIKAEERFGMVTDIAGIFLLEDKRQRIEAIHNRWNNLPNSAIAILSDSSAPHVSEVLAKITASKN